MEPQRNKELETIERFNKFLDALVRGIEEYGTQEEIFISPLEFIEDWLKLTNQSFLYGMEEKCSDKEFIHDLKQLYQQAIEKQDIDLWMNGCELAGQHIKKCTNRTELSSRFPNKDAYKAYIEGYLFSWDSVPGNDTHRLIDFLKNVFGINYVENNTKINKIINHDEVIQVHTKEKKVDIVLKDNKDKKIAMLKISGGPTYNLQAKKEKGVLKIYIESINKHKHVMEGLYGYIIYGLDIIKELKIEHFDEIESRFNGIKEELKRCKEEKEISKSQSRVPSALTEREEQLNKKREEIENLEKQLKKLDAEISTKNADLQSLEKTKSVLEEENKKKANIICELNADIDNLSKTRRQHEDILSKLKALLSKIPAVNLSKETSDKYQGIIKELNSRYCKEQINDRIIMSMFWVTCIEEINKALIDEQIERLKEGIGSLKLDEIIKYLINIGEDIKNKFSSFDMMTKIVHNANDEKDVREISKSQVREILGLYRTEGENGLNRVLDETKPELILKISNPHIRDFLNELLTKTKTSSESSKLAMAMIKQSLKIYLEKYGTRY